MIWRICNLIFGWDYVSWRNTADDGVARVFKSPEGPAYYFRYKLTKVVDVIKSKDQVIWLTCKADKYLGGDE